MTGEYGLGLHSPVSTTHQGLEPMAQSGVGAAAYITVLSSGQNGHGTESHCTLCSTVKSSGSPAPHVHCGLRFSSHSRPSQPTPWQGQPSWGAWTDTW